MSRAAIRSARGSSLGLDKKAREVPTGADDTEHGIAFSTHGKAAYVTNQGAGTLSVVDVTTNKVTTTIKVGAKPNGLV